MPTAHHGQDDMIKTPQTESAQTKTKGRRRRFQFSLRSFYLVTLLLGTSLGLWGRYIEPLRRQMQTAELLVAAGAKIDYEPSQMPKWLSWLLGNSVSGNVVEVRFERNPTSDELIDALVKLPYLRRLYLERTNVSDSQLATIGNMRRLEKLAVWGNYSVSDEGIRHLADLPALRVLDFSDTKATWRSRLLFSGRNVDVRDRNLYGDFYFAKPEEFDDLAALGIRVRSLGTDNPTDDQIDHAIQIFPELTGIHFELVSSPGMDPVTTKTPRFNQRGLETLRERNIKVNIRFDPIQHVDLVNTLFQIFGPTAESLWVSYSDEQTVLRLGNVHMHCRETLTGEAFGALPGLANVKSLRLDSDFNGDHMRVLSAMPNLRHLRFSDVGWATAIDENAMTIPKNLESIEIDALNAPDDFFSNDFFANLGCEHSLREVRIGIGRRGRISHNLLQPLLKLPKLERILKGDGGDLINLLPQLRERARATK